MEQKKVDMHTLDNILYDVSGPYCDVLQAHPIAINNDVVQALLNADNLIHKMKGIL